MGSATIDAASLVARFRAVEEATAHNNAAIELLHTGRTAEAAAGFRAAVAVQPDGPEAYYNLGIAYKDQGRHHASLTAYGAALALRPAFPEAHFNAGRALQMITEDPGPLGLLRPGQHAARQAPNSFARSRCQRAADHWRLSWPQVALLEAAAHFEASAGGPPAGGLGEAEAGAVSGKPKADSYRSLEEVLYQLGDHDGARCAPRLIGMRGRCGGQRVAARGACACAYAWTGAPTHPL